MPKAASFVAISANGKEWNYKRQKFAKGNTSFSELAALPPLRGSKPYFSILEQADDVVYVSREYSKNCMLKRNRYLVDHAACLLAVYNGEWRGGTAMTVRYAQKLRREIIVLNPNTKG